MNTDILFCGDTHGRLRHVVDTALRLQPMAIVLLGDIESPRPLHIELEPIRELVWWIHGNHDSDRDNSWRHLVDSELADRQLDGRVVTLADGTRLAGLGGTFHRDIWMPPAPAVHENYAAWLASCQWRRTSVYDTEKLQHRSSIFEDTYLALMTQRADILATHEAVSSHPNGFKAIDELAQSVGVQSSFHGHHHDRLDYSACWDGLGFKAYGVGLRGITDREGRVVVPGEKDEERAGRGSGK
jgi:predicted phosphodiesterase